MKIVQILSLIALAAVFTASASAFPYTNPTYTVGPLNASQPPPSAKGGSVAGSTTAGSTIAVYTQGRSIGQPSKNASSKTHLNSAKTAHP